MADAGALAALGADELNLGGVDGSLDLEDAALFALLAGLLMLGGNIDALDDDLHRLGVGLDDLALLALVLAGQDNDLIVSFNVHSLCPPLNHFGSQRQDLHVFLVAQLAGDGSKDTGTAGVLVTGVDQNRGVFVEADVGAVSAANGLDGADDDGLDHVALLDGAARGRLADGADDHVADARVLALGAAQHADAL